MQKYLFQFWLHFFSCTCFKRVLFLSDLDSHRCNTCQFDPFQPQPIRNIKNFCYPTYKNEKLGCVSNLKVLVQCQGESQNWRFPTFSVHFVLVQLKRGTLSNASFFLRVYLAGQSHTVFDKLPIRRFLGFFYFYGNYNTPFVAFILKVTYKQKPFSDEEFIKECCTVVGQWKADFLIVMDTSGCKL